jgi:hypothetical protein
VRRKLGADIYEYYGFQFLFLAPNTNCLKNLRELNTIYQYGGMFFENNMLVLLIKGQKSYRAFPEDVLTSQPNVSLNRETHQHRASVIALLMVVPWRGDHSDGLPEVVSGDDVRRCLPRFTFPWWRSLRPARNSLYCTEIKVTMRYLVVVP